MIKRQKDLKCIGVVTPTRALRGALVGVTTKRFITGGPGATRQQMKQSSWASRPANFIRTQLCIPIAILLVEFAKQFRRALGNKTTSDQLLDIWP